MRHFWLNDKNEGLRILSAFSSIFLRFALGFTFLSAVADRFGLWGAFGEPHVAWGTFARFVAYTGKLNWFLPRSVIPIPGHRCNRRRNHFCSLAAAGMADEDYGPLKRNFVSANLFALTMTVALGIKAPLDLSVFVDAGAGFLLATCAEYPVSIDHLRSRADRCE